MKLVNVQQMEYYQYFCSWIYDRTFPGRTGLTSHFVQGVKGFISWAWAPEICRDDGGIRCSCLNCRCRYIITDPKDLKKYLMIVGFTPDYWLWIYDGEKFQNFRVGVNAQAFTSHGGTNVEYNEDVNIEQFNMMDDMVADTLEVELSYGDGVEDDQEERPSNEKA